MAILPAGFFDIEPDAEAKAVSAEIKRDEYKRLLDKIHTIALGCSSRNTIAYVELPGAIEELIASRHKQWERAIAALERAIIAEEKIEGALSCLDNAAFDAGAMAARKILRGEK